MFAWRHLILDVSFLYNEHQAQKERNVNWYRNEKLIRLTSIKETRVYRNSLSSHLYINEEFQLNYIKYRHLLRLYQRKADVKIRVTFDIYAGLPQCLAS